MTNPLATRNAAFSPDIENLQVAWDSTSLGAFKECPRKYQYMMIEGWSPRQVSIHLKFGQVYHSALETYDHKKAQGLSHHEAMLSAIHHTMIETWDGGRPWITDDPNKNRETLVRTIVWYLCQFENDSLETVILATGKPAVELSFRAPLEYIAPDGQPYILCGHLDRLVLFQDLPYVLDRKTMKATISSETFTKYSPDNQMQIYDLAGALVYQVPTKGIIIDAAQIAVTFSRFQRGFVTYPPAMREEYYAELGIWFNVAASYAKLGYWPKNEKSCGNYGGCQFRPICSKSPGIREDWLKAGYFQRVWDPLKVRGDI